jgi:hypothetical protein
MRRILLLMFAACARIDPAPVEKSSEWTDVDADEVAAAMIQDCLSSTWPETWSKERGRKPVVRLHPIRNKTDAYIDYRYFTKQLEAALLRSGRVDVVSSLEEAGAAREERDDQALHASDETAKPHQNETGSDFILTGWILSEGGGTKSYLTSLELVETETQKKAWVGQKRIKKTALE